MRIGVLTGGGDCPGLNAVIRAVVRKGIDHYGDQVIGFRDGWRGVLEGSFIDLTIESTRGILPRGGTILGSSRTNPYKRDDGVDRVRRTLGDFNVDGIIAIGGEDTLGVANRLNATAESHNRILVVEVMGRTAGWIALHSGVAGGADVILIPEIPFDIDEVCRLIRRRHERGRYFSIVVAAEGAVPKDGSMLDVAQSGSTDEFGHVRLGGIGYALEREIEARTGFETRATVLGHVQRGGTPTAFDRVLATRLGLCAIDAAHEGNWGMMAALHSNTVELIALADAVAEVRRVPVEYYEQFDVLFG